MKYYYMVNEILEAAKHLLLFKKYTTAPRWMEVGLSTMSWLSVIIIIWNLLKIFYK